ncbi:MAG: hypothetical protein Q8L13_15970 [Bradyrhizobium sp.]|uniref:hypothetical protein n=1 Tax=Bradyrhizobium sp. TaxID=376 RepID=UPI00272F4559|nr:hypothetical protein [Bradyrhizobium sp.]MDP1867817.1 hypothetical protein [Bradyrhizobium sp.]
MMSVQHDHLDALARHLGIQTMSKCRLTVCKPKQSVLDVELVLKSPLVGLVALAGIPACS